MKRIDSLTDIQRAKMPEWRDKWIATGLKTGAMDLDTFKRGVGLAYQSAKLDQPKRIIVVTSPLALAFAAPTAAFILAQRVRGAVNDAVNDAVRDAVNDAVKTISESWWKYMGGQFWVGGWWYGSPAMVSFMTDVCGLELSEDMQRACDANRLTSESACWWWPHKEFVMVSERPIHIHRDEQGRLHSFTEASIIWPDGWGLYHIHGVRVPSNVVTAPESITVDEIEREQNAEVRRVMIELYGLERYVINGDAKEIHRDDFGILYRKEIPDDEPLVMVRVVNSTAEPDHSFKKYFIRVPPDIQRAREAVAWTFGKEENEYDPALQT